MMEEGGEEEEEDGVSYHRVNPQVCCPPVLADILFHMLTCFLWLPSLLYAHPISFLSHGGYNVLHPEPRFHVTHLSPHQLPLNMMPMLHSIAKSKVSTL